MRSKAHALNTKPNKIEKQKLEGLTKNVIKSKKTDDKVKCANWKPSIGEKIFIENVDNYLIWNENDEMCLQKMINLHWMNLMTKETLWTISKASRGPKF